MSVDGPPLDDVKEEDRIMVIDVLRTVKHLNICTVFDVKVAPKGYEVTCWFNTADEVNVSYEELGLVDQLNDTRIKLMGIRIEPDAKRACLKIRVISLSEPAMVTDAIVMRVWKRARWWGRDA